jgi:hypothetical protein
VQHGEPTRRDVTVAKRVTRLLCVRAQAGYGWLPSADVVAAEAGNCALCRWDRRRA